MHFETRAIKADIHVAYENTVHICSHSIGLQPRSRLQTARWRMSYVFHRRIGALPPVAVRGDGVYLFDAEGRRYLDGYSGGACVSNLGHGHPAVVAAIQEQIGKLAWVHNSVFTTEPLEEFAEVLAQGAPPGLGHVLF